MKEFGSDFKTQILFFHDIGEYHERYLEFARFCNDASIGITFVDMRGHGLSSGVRGHARNVEQILNDYELFWNNQFKKYENKKIISIGHGVGALLAMQFLLKKQDVDGAVLVNPTINFRKSKTFKFNNIFKLQSLLDKVKIKLHDDEEGIGKEGIMTDLNHDPLINKKITLGMYKSLLNLFNKVKHSSYFINRPILYIIGNQDHIVDLELSKLFASSIDENYLHLKVYEDVGHEFFNEIDRDKGFKDIYNWINNNFLCGR